MAYPPTWTSPSSKPPWRSNRPSLPGLIERNAKRAMPGHPAGPRPRRLRCPGPESGRHRFAQSTGPALRNAAAPPRCRPGRSQSLCPHANVDAARAAFFPQIGLTGSAGYASAAIDGLINPANFAWSIGASLLQTIFDGGKLKAAGRSGPGAADSDDRQLSQGRFTAFSDVETSLGQAPPTPTSWWR